MLLIILLGIAVCLKSCIQGGAVSDDIPALQKDLKIKNLFWRYYYIVRGVKYWNMREAHIVTSAIHIANAVLIFYVFGQTDISLLASLLFVANPVGSQCFLWPSGKIYSTALFFVLLMFLVPYGAGIFLAGAIWGSSAAIVSWIPFLLVHKWYWLLSFIPVCWYGYSRVKREIKSHQYLFKKDVVSFSLKKLPKKIIIIIKTFGFYVRFALFPFHLGWDLPFLHSYGHSIKGTQKAENMDIHFWWGVFIIPVILFGIISYWGKPLSFGLIWFCVNISLWINIISGSGRTTERYVYISNAGLMLALAALLSQLDLQTLGLFIAGAYAMKTYLYTMCYINAYWHIEHICIEQPRCVTGWQRKGCDAVARQDFRIGYQYLVEALACSKGDDMIAHFNLAVATFCLGDIVKARTHFTIAKAKLSERTDADYTQVLANFEKQLIEADIELKTKKVYEVKFIQLLSVN